MTRIVSVIPALWHVLSWHCEAVSDALMMSFTSVSTRGRLTDVYKSPEDRLVSEQTVGVFLARKYDFDDRTENDFFLEWWEREVTGHERRGRGGCWLREGKARSMPVGEEKTWGHVWLWGGGKGGFTGRSEKVVKTCEVTHTPPWKLQARKVARCFYPR